MCIFYLRINRFLTPKGIPSGKTDMAMENGPFEYSFPLAGPLRFSTFLGATFLEPRHGVGCIDW